MISRLRGRYNTVWRVALTSGVLRYVAAAVGVGDKSSRASRFCRRHSLARRPARHGPFGYYAPRQLVFGVDRSGPPTLRTTGCVACIFTDGQQMRLSSTALASAVRNPIGQSNFRAMACSRSHPTPHPHPRNHLEHSEAACVVKFDRGLPPS